MKNISAKEHFGRAITIRELVKDYKVDKETGEITCFGGKLNPRPSYQREFVYNEQEQTKVFETLYRAFPLGIMYWCDIGNGKYELIDGQQRTLSICRIINNEVKFNYIGNEDKYFDDLSENEQEQILDQELLIFVCSGSQKEKMDWFKTINIAGKALTKQELLSAVYAGSFVSDARTYFVSKAEATSLSNGYDDYVPKATSRQELLERVLNWKANAENKKDIEDYLGMHKDDKDAKALFDYYEEVLRWAKNLFGNKYKKIQQRVDWGILFNKYHEKYYGSKDVQNKLDELMKNEDIQKQENIYEYILTDCTKEKLLHIRAFTDKDKMTKYAQQNCQCADCGKHFELNELEAHHDRSWRSGGSTTIDNLVLLCSNCHHLRHGA